MFSLILGVDVTSDLGVLIPLDAMEATVLMSDRSVAGYSLMESQSSITSWSTPILMRISPEMRNINVVIMTMTMKIFYLVIILKIALYIIKCHIFTSYRMVWNLSLIIRM